MADADEPPVDHARLFALLTELLRASIPMLRTFALVDAELQHPSISRAMRELASRIESGGDLSSALPAHPLVFPPPLPALFRTMEKNGTWLEGFQRLAEGFSGDALQKFMFTTGLSIRLGASYEEALATASTDEPNLALRAIFAELRAELASHGTIAAALARHPSCFTPVMIALIHEAETRGRLDETFLQIAAGLRSGLFKT